MDPFTVALAVFGVQKLRGKSTGRSFRDALLAAGGVQLGASAGIGGLKGFTGLGASGEYALGSGDFLSQLGETFAGKGIKGLYGTPGIPEVKAVPEQLPRAAIYDETTGELLVPARKYVPPVVGTPAVPATGFQSLSPTEKFITAGIGIPLVASAFTDEEPPAELPPGFKPEDYLAAKAPARQQLLGVGERADYMGTPRYTAAYPYGLFNKGGIVNALPKFSVGGINYLPSKVTHDENDVNNYNRTNGYVEDGSGNGDKDEDTILAQLADGEFVSRADAILGAGILEGASPSNYKDMRKKGAAFFYDQQAKFKRIFDLLDASRKTVN